MTLLITLAAGALAAQPAAALDDNILVHPLFEGTYSCTEHRDGELQGPGDALGADCWVFRVAEAVDGRRFARQFLDDGFENEDWYGWRASVLSPIGGTVLRRIDNPDTNQPGFPGRPPASLIVLRAEDGTHVLVAHLRETSVTEGDRVERGETIGRVGNNGYSYAPHIHIGAWRGQRPLQIRFDLSARIGEGTQ